MTSDFNKLSERQKNILIFMDKYLSDNGFPPTIREIGKATKIDSTSVVNYNLNKLVQAGFLSRAESKSRGLRLVRDLPNHTQTSKVRSISEVLHIRNYGQIVAGSPVNSEADNDDENVVDVPASMLAGVNPSELFALTVKGQSMIDAMIQDGDVVILRQTNKAKNGDMVAVWLTDRSETTLKHFYNEGNRIRLQPANPTMDPIYVDPSVVEIQGKVLSVMRRVK